MAKLNFPGSPSPGTLYTENGNAWQWNGNSWVSFNSLDLTSQVSGALGVTYGGTGYSTYSTGTLLVGAGSSFIRLIAGPDNFVLTASSSSSSGITWSPSSSVSSGSGLSILNSLTSGIQYFSTGTSGNIFNISSSGSTHTFNIPIAGSASTGLISTSSQTIAGQKTFTSAIIGDLIGTATTSGFATTANYSHQSGYAITSSSSGIASTSTYALQAGYGSTAGFATTANYSYQSGYGLTSGLATTSTYSLQSGYGITSGTATTSTNINVVSATSNSIHRVLFTPSTGTASGAAVSTENSFVYNPFTDILSVSGLAVTSSLASTSTSTGSLIVSGGTGIQGALNIGGATRIFSTTASTSPSTGSLLVAGGLGVSGQLSFVNAALGFTGITTNPSMAFIGATSSAPITLTVQTDNSLSWEGNSGQLFSIDNNLSSGEIFSVSDISGLPVISASAGQTINLNEFGGYTQVGNGLASTSTTTGALRVVGGLGVTGNVAIGGTFIRSSWTVGETINTAMYNYSDLSMAGITTITSTTLTRIGNITYTPKSSSSYIWIEFHANYDFVDGSLGDDFWSSLAVNGTEIAAINQRMVNSAGGGTRSGTLFPISTRYTNSTTSGIAITVQAKRGTADDNIRVYGSSTSGYMRIQEIGR